MPFDRFLIAPIATGLQTDLKPWIIPDDAFAELTNAYVFRGRVRKRFGSYFLNASRDSIAQLNNRLRINLGNTSGSGNISVTVPGAIFAVGQMFSIAQQIFTVVVTGTPGTMLKTGAATLATYNTTTGALVINGAAAATPVYFYPADPVMGLITYEIPDINNEPVFAFDTQFAYQFSGSAWSRLGTAIWTGDNSQFFWGATYRGNQEYDDLLFVTNFNSADGMQYWNGTVWANLNPAFNVGGDTIETARIIVPFKDRLLLLNTIENISASDHSFINRVRFSQNGSPLQSDAWRDDIPGKGGYLDNVATKEAIITCEFLKDRLIVFFERSTWELVYTGNEILPFRWQQINTELGAESTFSVVPFDKVVLGIGNVGIHACNGANVERIDQKIPDEVFKIHNLLEGVERVYGIRDYYVEMVYWTFPATTPSLATFPTQVLVYNYKTGSWAFNEDSITVFGYFQKQSDITWATLTKPWETYDEPWQSGIVIARFKQVIAGNQEGFVFIVDSDTNTNVEALQITNITLPSGVVTIKAINHNLYSNSYVKITEAQGITQLNGNIYQVRVIDDNTFSVIEPTATGTYTGGGVIARVSNINILTKQYNFYVQDGRNFTVNKVDFLVDRTPLGAVSIDSLTSYSNFVIDTQVLETFAYPLIPLEQEQERLWHPVYFSSEGESVQLRIYMNDAQMRDASVSSSNFEMHAMLFQATPTSNRLQ